MTNEKSALFLVQGKNKISKRERERVEAEKRTNCIRKREHEPTFYPTNVPYQN